MLHYILLLFTRQTKYSIWTSYFSFYILFLPLCLYAILCFDRFKSAHMTVLKSCFSCFSIFYDLRYEKFHCQLLLYCNCCVRDNKRAWTWTSNSIISKCECWKSCHPDSLFRKLTFFLNFGGVKPLWADLPYAPNDQTGRNGKPCTHEVSARSLDSPFDRQESLLTSENPLILLILNLLIQLQSSIRWEVRNHNLCLLGTALSKTAPTPPLTPISIWFLV